MSSSGRPRVALVTTIYNEAGSLPALLESIAAQTRSPDEVVVTDGGSSDKSVSILKSWIDRLPLTVIVAPGANISEGRNIAINASSSELIAVTDAGVTLDPDWLSNLIAPLEQRTIDVDVSAGFFLADSQNEFEHALAATTLPDADEIDPASFLPSSRSVAFRKSWFESGVQYPEWLDYCEDLVFDLRLKRAGARFLFQPQAVVYFRPRGDLRSFWKQYFRYARGDGKAGLFLKRHLVRYATYLLLVPIFALSRNWLWRLVILSGAIAYVRNPVQRLWKRSEGDLATTLKRAPMTAILRAVGDFAKMAGYPVGLVWRARRYGLRRNWRSIPETSDTTRR